MDTKINKLKAIDKTTNPFKVPDNYFAQFNEEIMNRLPEKEIVVPEPVSIWDKVKPWVYLAAMFVGLSIAINFLLKSPKDGNMTGDQLASQQTLSASTDLADKYWSTAQITEEEIYQ